MPVVGVDMPTSFSSGTLVLTASAGPKPPQPFFVQAVSRAAGNPSDVYFANVPQPRFSATIGHTDASFTLRTHVHLLDEDQPEVPFGARDGNATATRAAQNDRDTARAVIAETSGFAAESSDTARAAEMTSANS
jgi:hypothetical protein